MISTLAPRVAFLQPGVTLGPWAGALVIVACAAVLFDLTVQLRRSRAAGALGSGVALAILRCLAVTGVLGMVLELSFVSTADRGTSRRATILVDTSASMAIPDATGATEPEPRHRRAARAFAASDTLQRWATDGGTMDTRTFDDALDAPAGDPVAAMEATPSGPASDLAGALDALRPRDGTGAGPDALVVVSDGLVAPTPAEQERVRAAARASGVPVTAVAVGGSHLRDVAVAALQAEMFAFVENVTTFRAELVAQGYAGRTLPVRLLRDGVEVLAKSVTLGEDGVPTVVEFEAAPDRVGQFVYEVAVKPPPDDASPANDRRAFVVKVLRDKVRVLHVAGRPDWDVRALRTLLRRDPNVELLSYYILRGRDDNDRDLTDRTELSLIEFPTDELFSEELGSFDLVILQDFDSAGQEVTQYHREIARYVHDGGALVLVGGDLGLATGDYGDPDMREVVPVDATRPAPLEAATVRPTLTQAGRRHPVTRWLAASGGWGSLPPLRDVNRATALPEGHAMRPAVLLEDPRGGTPLLAVAEPGRGRSLVWGTASSWRLGFASDLAATEGGRPYDRFWLAAVRWLLRDDEADRLVLESDKPSYAPGEEVRLAFTTLDEEYAPEPGVEIEWNVRRIDAPKTVIASGTVRSDALGRAHAVSAAADDGAYEAIATRTPSATSGESARRVFLVEPPVRELARIHAAEGTAFLAALARETSGTFVNLAAGDELPSQLPHRESGVERSATLGGTPVWDHPLWMVLTFAALGGEWILRRRLGWP